MADGLMCSLLGVDCANKKEPAKETASSGTPRPKEPEPQSFGSWLLSPENFRIPSRKDVTGFASDMKEVALVVGTLGLYADYKRDRMHEKLRTEHDQWLKEARDVPTKFYTSSVPPKTK